MLTATNDNGNNRWNRAQQGTVQHVSSTAHTAHDDEEDDTDWETDEDRHGVQYTGSTDPGLVTLRLGCNDGASTSTERRQEDNFDEDGAGQHSGEHH